MEAHEERQIAAVLKHSPTREQLRRWISDGLQARALSLQQARTLTLLACRINDYRLAMQFLIRFIREGRPVPWGIVGRLLKKAQPQPSRKLLEKIAHAVTDQDQSDELLQFEDFDKIFPELVTIIAAIKEKHEKLHRSKKMELLERLTFLRDQRMLEEENRTLQELAAIFPNDKGIANQLHDLQMRQARDLLSQRAKPIDDEFKYIQILRSQDKALEPMRKKLVLSLLNVAKQQKTAAYDIAIALLQLDSPDDALLAIQQAPPSPSKQWLELEIYLQSRRFLDAIAWASEIEKKSSQDPEVTFACTYAKARALYGLGKKEMAIDLLSSIVNIRPNYRSAHSLLLQWQGAQ